MSSPYVAEVLMVCPVAHVQEASAVAASFTGNPIDAITPFFSRPIISLETGEVTHYLAGALAARTTIQQLPLLEIAYPGAAWAVWRIVGDPSPMMSPPHWLATLGLAYAPDPPDEP